MGLQELWLQAFAADLRALFEGLSALDPQVILETSASSQAMAASLAAEDGDINRLLLQVPI